jgi:hypothetical protein
MHLNAKPPSKSQDLASKISVEIKSLGITHDFIDKDFGKELNASSVVDRSAQPNKLGLVGNILVIDQERLDTASVKMLQAYKKQSEKWAKMGKKIDLALYEYEKYKGAK